MSISFRRYSKQPFKGLKILRLITRHKQELHRSSIQKRVSSLRNVTAPLPEPGSKECLKQLSLHMDRVK